MIEKPNLTPKFRHVRLLLAREKGHPAGTREEGYDRKRWLQCTLFQLDGVKFHGRSSSILFFGCPAAMASSVALR